MPEKVTRPSRSATRPGPTPRTRWNSSREPNGPLTIRSLTMRRASTPPMRGSASISLSLARSRSTRSATARGPPGKFPPTAFDSDRPPDLAEWRDRTSLPRAESTAAIWRASAWLFAASDAPPRAPRTTRTTRTLAPSTMTPARNNSALRSAGVGMAPRSHRRRRTESSVYSRLGAFYAWVRLCYTAGATSRAQWLRSPAHRPA